MRIYKEFFKHERKRDYLARTGNLKLLKRSYRKNYELENFNTQMFWDKRVVDYHRNLLASPIYKDKVKFICSQLKNEKGAVLNIGFGYGDLETCLATSKLNLFGIDISKRAVQRIKNRIRGVYKVSNILHIPFRDSYFDFVLALDVLEHISPSKTFKAISEIRRVLKKGGKLIVSVPLNEQLDKLLAQGKNPNAHVREYTPALLKAEFELFDFLILRDKYFYAFSNFYSPKNFLLKIFPQGFRKPNLIVIIAKK